MLSGYRVNEAEVSLREWLETAAPKRGARLPSERALAAQLGLRHYALNRAMGRLIAEGLVERTGYKLFAAGGAPSPSRTALTCHVVVALRSIYIPGYRRIAKEMGIRLVLHTWESIDEAIITLEKLDSRETEAVVFDPPYWSPVSLWGSVTDKLRRRGIPVVCIGQDAPNLSSVLADHARSLQLALLHLIELGHGEFGLITSSSISPASAEVLQVWEELCQKYGLKQSIRRIHLQHTLRLKEETEEVAGLVAHQWSAITALIVVGMPECNIQLLTERLLHNGRHIPRDLSLLLVGESKSASTATPPVSAVSVDMAAMQETAFFLAQRANRKKTLMGISSPPCSLRLQPQLILRKSTGAIDPAKAPPAAAAPAFGEGSAPVAPSAGMAPPAAEECLKKAYPLAARAFLSERRRFFPVDLRGHVNRPLNFRRGWLGDLPLRHLAPGPHEIHGVPFHILGGPKRSDCGTIVFHSTVNTTGNARRLPDRIRIPIRAKVQAAYVLHGCGYAKFLHSFACYSFRSRTAVLGQVPLVSLGQPPPSYHFAPPGPEEASPNIQDWWPDFPHQDFPHARMAPILDSDHSGHEPRHAYLYTLEWINPSPETVVSCLEITVDPAHATTLGVLAVTILKP